MKTDIQSIIDGQKDNGGPFWSRADGDIHAPHGKSTMDTLLVLGELKASLTEYPFISKAIEFVLSYQTEEGCFKYSKTSSKLPCMAARILAAFGRLGAKSNERIEKSYQKLLKTQSPDGGWRCNTVKMGKSPSTDASNPGTTLYVLDAFRYRNNGKQDIDQLNLGADFVLQHWEVREPVGPCNFGIGSRFLQIEYPFLRYNLFYYIYVLSFYKKCHNDSRFLEAYQYLVNKIKNNSVIPENPHKAWRKFDFAKPGKISDLATKRWLEIKMNIK